MHALAEITDLLDSAKRGIAHDLAAPLGHLLRELVAEQSERSGSLLWRAVEQICRTGLAGAESKAE